MKKSVKKSWETIVGDILDNVYSLLKKEKQLGNMTLERGEEKSIKIIFKFGDKERKAEIKQMWEESKKGDSLHIKVMKQNEEYNFYNAFATPDSIVADIKNIYESFEYEIIASEKIEPIKFELTAFSTKRANDFCKKHKKCQVHSTEGTSCVTYTFQQSAIGDFVSIKCTRCGKEEDITDYNF